MLLNVSNVSKAFGPDHILTGVTLRVDVQEKVALVGRNGTGKTTLLKILTGQYPPDSGSVHLARGAAAARPGHRGEQERMIERQKEIARRRHRKEKAQKARKRAAIAAAKKSVKKA